MTCLYDLLCVYSNTDVVPFIQATETLSKFYFKQDIDLFMHTFSVPGAALDSGASIPLINEIDADLYHTMKANITGGPAIVHHRYAEVGKTYIRDNPGKSGLALLYWIQYISQKNLCTKLQVCMQPAKLLHLPKCTTLIWNMDVVCIFFFLFALLCIYYLSHLFSLYSFLILFLFSFMLFLCSFTVLVPLSLLYLTIRTY